MRIRLRYIFLILLLVLIGLTISNYINRGLVDRLGFSNSAPIVSNLQSDNFSFSTPEKLDQVMQNSSSLSLKVANVSQSISKISDIAKNLDGYLTSANTSRLENGQIYGEITVAVPQDKLEIAINQIKSASLKVVQENINNRSRLQEKTDIDARLKNYAASEAQLQKLMEKSGSVNEVLQVQRELSTVRQNIETLKAQLDLLNKSVAFATITANLSTQEELLPLSDDQWQPLATAKSAVRLLVKVVKFSLNLGIWLSVFILPLVLLILIPILIIKKIKKTK